MWAKGGPEIVNAIGCADCHDVAAAAFKEGAPSLHLSRPYAERALTSIGKPFKTQGRFEQQVQVCAQRHVEYYFTGPVKAVKLPWDKGVSVEAVERHFDEAGVVDWIHALSKAPMLKPQHPEYETWRGSVHDQNNVNCIDGHMPKLRNTQGAFYADHKIGNPLTASSRPAACAMPKTRRRCKTSSAGTRRRRAN